MNSWSAGRKEALAGRRSLDVARLKSERELVLDFLKRSMTSTRNSSRNSWRKRRSWPRETGL